MGFEKKVLCLSGGIGGAKLALGLYRTLKPSQLSILSNTGDDFEHFGLHISPDLDTVMYTLAGESNIEQGWGRANETWTFMEQMRRLGGNSWFNLGDGDLAIHMRRTQMLAEGKSLQAIANEFCHHLGVNATLLPMSNDPVRTRVTTGEGEDLMFQHYLVRDMAEHVVQSFNYVGAAEAQANPELLALLQDPDLEAIIICPSNPYVSIDPILAVPGVRDALKACKAPIVAVSPIVGGQAIKGPLAKMMSELQVPVKALSIAEYYDDLLAGFVLDTSDAELAADLQMPGLVTNTVMLSLQDRETLAQTVLEFTSGLR